MCRRPNQVENQNQSRASCADRVYMHNFDISTKVFTKPN